MTIYCPNLNHLSSLTLTNYVQDFSNSACQRVAVLMSGAIQKLQQGKLPKQQLQQLGLSTKDPKAFQAISKVLSSLPQAQLISEEDPHSFQVMNAQGAPLGTFRVGERRAHLELLKSNLRHLCSLTSKGSSFRVFCSATDLPCSSERPLIKQLFNGHWVTIHPVDPETYKTSKVVLGVFSTLSTSSTEEQKVLELVLDLIAFAFDPVDLGKDIDLHALIPAMTVETLKQIVSNWNVNQIISFAKNEEVLFYDDSAESMGSQAKGIDAEGNALSVCSSHLDKENDLYDDQSNPDLLLLRPKQIEQMRCTLETLKRFIPTLTESISAYTLIEELNRRYALHSFPQIALTQKAPASYS